MNRRTFVQAGAVGLGAAGFPLRIPGRSALWVSPPALADDRMAWWREARFGMFLHWGLYSILAGEWMGRTDHAEWIRTTAHIPLEEYDKLVARFDPASFDADAWVGMAKDAGMKYVTITSKHHDGFCLFDNRLTDFCIRSTPFKRDICKEMADACRRAGLRICWYHSIMDWHHPDYLPRRDWEAETRPVNGARFGRFVEYLHGCVEQLLHNYGDIGVMWFDGQWEGTWTHELGRSLYARCRELEPSVIVNNRCDGWSQTPVTDPLGDFRTPEQEIPATGWAGVDWESCITMNRNWGYNAHDANWKSVPQLIGMLVETASKGGNLLLNIGPKADGTFPQESVERLSAIGRWMKANGEAIYGTSASLFSNPALRTTTKGRRVYVFLTQWVRGLRLPELRTQIQKAYLLTDPARTPLATSGVEGDQGVILPPRAPDPDCSVVVLEFDRRPEVLPNP